MTYLLDEFIIPVFKKNSYTQRMYTALNRGQYSILTISLKIYDGVNAFSYISSATLSNFVKFGAFILV